MHYPQIPQNEEQRLKALKSYKILDTLPEEDYDSITRIAALICNKPIALINLVDSEWTFLKSTHGANLENAPRKLSFCSSTINNPQELMIVKDSRIDPRFADHPYVTGKPHVIFYAGVPLVNKDGLALGAICVIDDKPGDLNEEQKAALKGLSKQVINLMELRKTNIQLEEYQHKLELHSEEMESFAYIASHDLKDPLRMVRIFLQKLKIKYGGALDSTANRYIDISVSSSIKMTDLINDLLEYAKLNKEQENTKEINLQELIQEIISYHAAVFEEAKANITFSDLPNVKGFRTMLKIVIQNLLMNAIKFKKPTEPLQIKIAVEEKPLLWIFKITDNGIGIDATDHTEIFKPFKRLNAHSEYKGSGLGLAACKKLIERHNGKIWVESKIGVGSSFYFEVIK